MSPKRTTVFSLFALLLWGGPLLGADMVALQPLSKAYVPGGFTNRDRVEFVVSGFLPATNYSVQQVKCEVDQERKIISVKRYTREFRDGIGFKPLEPIEAVNVVTLATPIESGEYKIIDALNAKEIGHVSVGKAPKEDDDSNKLEVSSVESIDVAIAESGTPELVITAWIPKSVSLQAKILYFENSIVILPFFPESKEASEAKGNVLKRLHLPLREPLKGKYLLHVRYAKSNAEKILQTRTLNRLQNFPLEK